jgi:hypothetical protein
VSLKRRLRTLACCGLLQIAALFGMPMRPEEIQEFMQSLNEQKVAHTLPEEEEKGKGANP